MKSQDQIQDTFIAFIDNMVSSEINAMLQDEIDNCVSMIDLINVQEKARVLTIKHRISSTHTWFKASCVDSKGHRSVIFWCDKCNMRCSEFEHINCLSIISKVKDNLPTYTVHNQYLMYTCDQLLNKVHPGKDMRCFECGIPENAKTNNCNLAEC